MSDQDSEASGSDSSVEMEEELDSSPEISGSSNSCNSSSDGTKSKEVIVEIVEQDYPEKDSLLIKGDYDFEIPEIVHQVLLFLPIKDIANCLRVSKTFYKVGTNDLIWSRLIKNSRSYFSFSNVHKDNKRSLINDLRSLRKGNKELYPKVSNIMNEQLIEKRKEEKLMNDRKSRREKIYNKKKNIKETRESWNAQARKNLIITFIFFFVLTIIFPCLFIPLVLTLALLIQFAKSRDLMYFDFVWSEESILKMHLLHISDFLCAQFCSIFGWHCCCNYFQCLCNSICCFCYCFGFCCVPFIFLQMLISSFCCILMAPTCIGIVPAWAFIWTSRNWFCVSENDKCRSYSYEEYIDDENDGFFAYVPYIVSSFTVLLLIAFIILSPPLCIFFVIVNILFAVFDDE